MSYGERQIRMGDFWGMKKIIAFLLVLAMVFVLCACGCEHEFSDWVEVKKATSFEEGLQRRTCSKCGETEQEKKPKEGDHGVKLGSYEMEEKAKRYVKSKFTTTAGGYKITSYTFGSISKGGNDDLDIYQYYTVYGSYTYNGKDKYGQTQKGEKTFTYRVKVYQWSKNPDGYPSVSNN